jgi:hypothetical protein
MAGLIWSGVGQGIASAGSTIGSMGVRDYEMRESARLRREDKEEDRAWREEQKDLDRDRQDERDRMYRKTVEQQIAGNKGTGGMKGFAPEDIAPGGKLADMMAGQMGMTVPEYEQFYNSRKTGDMSAYETGDIVGAKADEAGPTPIRAVPEGFKKEYAAKSKMLSDIQQAYVAGSEAKNIAEGRQIGLVTNAMENVQSGGDATKAAQLGAISKGHAPFAGDSNVTRNVLTGDTSTTAVGTATIGEKGALAKQAEAGAKENEAQAKAADALAAERTKNLTKLDKEVLKIEQETKKLAAETGNVGVNKTTHETLTASVNSAVASLKLLQDGSHGTTPEEKKAWQAAVARAEAVIAQAQDLQVEQLGKRKAPDAPAAADKGGTQPVANDGIPTVTYEEAKKLKSGTRFRVSGSNEIRTKN